MVLKSKLPNYRKTLSLIEEFLPRTFNLPHVSLTQYLSIEGFAYRLKIPRPEARRLLHRSDTSHAVVHDKMYYVHPTPVINFIVTKMLATIEHELNATKDVDVTR